MHEVQSKLPKSDEVGDEEKQLVYIELLKSCCSSEVVADFEELRGGIKVALSFS